jgi:hypothetical protein
LAGPRRGAEAGRGLGSGRHAGSALAASRQPLSSCRRPPAARAPPPAPAPRTQHEAHAPLGGAAGDVVDVRPPRVRGAVHSVLDDLPGGGGGGHAAGGLEAPRLPRPLGPAFCPPSSQPPHSTCLRKATPPGRRSSPPDRPLLPRSRAPHSLGSQTGSAARAAAAARRRPRRRATERARASRRRRCREAPRRRAAGCGRASRRHRRAAGCGRRRRTPGGPAVWVAGPRARGCRAPRGCRGGRTHLGPPRARDCQAAGLTAEVVGGRGGERWLCWRWGHQAATTDCAHPRPRGLPRPPPPRRRTRSRGLPMLSPRGAGDASAPPP